VTEATTPLDAALSSPAPIPPASTRGARTPWPLLVLGVVLGLCFVGPLVYLLVRTLGFGADALDVLGSDDALGPLSRTLLLATTVSATCAGLGLALAWLVTRTDLPGRRVLRVLLVLPLVIPSFVGAFALQAAFVPDGLFDELLGLGAGIRIHGFWGSYGAITLLSYPYVYLPVLARLASLPPSLEESARALGRPPAAVFRTVVLPQTTAALAGGTLLTFLYCVSEFGAVSLMRYDTLTLRIESSRLLDRTTSITLSLLLAVVALAVVGGERALARRRAPIDAVGAGRRPLVHPLGRWKVPAFGFVLSVLFVALAAPVAVLVDWSVKGLSGGRFAGPDGEVGDLWTPALNTAGVALVAALVAVTLLLPLAYLTARHRTWLSGGVNTVVVGAFGLPGLVIALALVFWVLGTPAVRGLYQTYALLVFAYVVHFGAQALRTSQVAVSGLPRGVSDAARSLGAGWARRVATVDVPLVLPGIAAGAGLVLLSVMKELPATLLLAPIGFETLAIKVWSAAESGLLGQAGVASLLLVAVSAALVWLLTIRRMGRLAA
jgi:iron(III) transport system permease protein